MQLTLDITDDNQLAGLAAARAGWDAANPDNPMASDEAYLQARINDVLDSYAAALVAQRKSDAFAAFEAGDTAPIKALIADMEVAATVSSVGAQVTVQSLA